MVVGSKRRTLLRREKEPVSQISFDTFLVDPELTDETAERKDQKDKGGRPSQFARQALYGQRDKLLDLLASSWQKIGLRIQSFRRVKSLGLKDVRETFELLRNERQSQLLVSILRESSAPTSAKSIRTLRGKLGPLADRVREEERKHAIKAERLRDIKSALGQLTLKEEKTKGSASRRAVLRDREAIKLVAKKRCTEFQEVKASLRDARQCLSLAESALEDHEAYFAQSELLKFLKSPRNRLDPKRLADAMAGLPLLGSRRSSDLCKNQPTYLWPHPHYEMVKEVERIWRMVPSRARASAVEVFRTQIMALPKKSKNNIKIQLRSNLCENWRYFERAILDCVTTDLSSAETPHRIVESFTAHVAAPRDALERTRAEQQALVDEE